MTSSGSVAVVTGGARGIGRAIAHRLLDDGYSVGVLDVIEPADDGLAEQARQLGRGLVALGTDVGDPDEVELARHEVETQLGPVAALVNNAAIYPRAFALELDWKIWSEVVRVNLGGAFLCSKAFGAGMVARGAGAIVNVASGAIYTGHIRGTAYAAAKSGLVGLTRSLALEWAPTVRVNLVVPGVTDTAQPLGSGRTRDEIVAAAAESVPLGRIGEGRDVAGAVSFLLGPDSAYITGGSVCVNGGSVMR